MLTYDLTYDLSTISLAMRQDHELIKAMRKDKPEWVKIIDGDEDGTYDIDGFQKILKENYKAMRRHEKTQLHEDGSAVDPEGACRPHTYPLSRMDAAAEHALSPRTTRAAEPTLSPRHGSRDMA